MAFINGSYFSFNSNLNLDYSNKKQIIDSLFMDQYPFIVKKNFKLSEFNIKKIENKISLNKEIFSRTIFDYYQDNFIIRSSTNFKFCLDNLKQVKFKKKNVV